MAKLTIISFNIIKPVINIMDHKNSIRKNSKLLRAIAPTVSEMAELLKLICVIC